MRLSKFFILISLLMLAGCTKSAPPPIKPPPPAGANLPVVSGINIMSLTVNGANCSANSYVNKPCVSVKICSVDGQQCQTVNDILLDTGSFGLRIFSSVITVPLSPITSGDSILAECVQFGDGSSDWGSIDMAKVTLANEDAIEIPIQVINSSVGTRPSQCSSSDGSPSAAGFNGILGVGFYPYDCGTANNGCISDAANNFYYSCTGSSCVGTTVSLENQVKNPIPFLNQDNNGVILSLPAVASGGAAFANGYLILGIGTQSNNQPVAGLTAFTANTDYGEFTTEYNGQSYDSFIDSGSNAIYFDDSSIADCSRYSAQMSDFYCPSSALALSATTIGINNSQAIIPLSVQNVESLLQGGGSSFNNITGKGNGLFDWGLPFYLGRNVYQGIYGKSSSLGSDNYWAY